MNLVVPFPETRALAAQIDALEKELLNSREDTVSNLELADADNPAFIQMKGQLETVNAELRSMRQKKLELRAKIDEYNDRLAKMPKVEQEYRLLVRDYESETLKFRDLLAKQMEAEVSENLEISRKGERFTLIEPALLPETPSKPNRLAIFVLGAVLSIGAGARKAFRS